MVEHHPCVDPFLVDSAYPSRDDIESSVIAGAARTMFITQIKELNGLYRLPVVEVSALSLDCYLASPGASYAAR